MFYSKPDRDGKISGASWDIWPSSSIPSLSKALDPSASDEQCRLGQAIVSETQYISVDAARSSFLDSGVRGWRTIQRPGEAVIIPPGCPHQVSVFYSPFVMFSDLVGQVSNLSNCFKIAIDFVSPYHTPVFDMLWDAFRTMNLQVGEDEIVHNDLLQLDAMAWYAWRSTM